MESLPPESLHHILSHLDPRSLLRFSACNHFLHSLCTSPSLWHHLFLQMFGSSPLPDPSSNSPVNPLLAFKTRFVSERDWARASRYMLSEMCLGLPGRISAACVIPRGSDLNGVRHSTWRGIERGSLVLLGGERGTIYPLEIAREGFEQRTQLQTHQQAILKLVWLADLGLVASGSVDGTVTLLRPNREHMRGGEPSFSLGRTLKGHEGRILSISAWKGRVVTAGMDGGVRCWDPDSGACLVEWRVQVGPDGKAVAASEVSSRGSIAVAGRGVCVIWDLVKRAKAFEVTLPVEDGMVGQVHLDPDLLLLGFEKRIAVFRPVPEFRHGGWGSSWQLEKEIRVWGGILAWAFDGSRVVSSTKGPTLISSVVRTVMAADGMDDDPRKAEFGVRSWVTTVLLLSPTTVMTINVQNMVELHFAPE